MLHCTYVLTTCDVNKFVIIVARDSAVHRLRKKRVLALVPTLAALGFVGEVRRKQLLPVSAASRKGPGPWGRAGGSSNLVLIARRVARPRATWRFRGPKSSALTCRT